MGIGTESLTVYCSLFPLWMPLFPAVQFMARLGGKFQVGAKDPAATGAALLRLYV